MGTGVAVTGTMPAAEAVATFHLVGIQVIEQARPCPFIHDYARANDLPHRGQLAQGMDLVTWTFDPLESRNARLNFHKLGVTCNTYLRDLYGSMRDELNVGLPSDRFQVDWWLLSRRVERRLSGQRRRMTLAEGIAAGGELVNETGLAGGVRVPAGAELSSRSASVLIEIPSDFQTVKRADMHAARRWRLHTRQLFEGYFEVGYTVTDFVSEVTADERRNFYLLERDV